MPTDSEYRKVEKRLDAIAPQAPQDIAAWFDETLPTMAQVLSGFPGEIREKVLAAVRAESGDEFERLRVIATVLELFPAAYQAVKAAIRAEDRARRFAAMTPEEREREEEKERTVTSMMEQEAIWRERRARGLPTPTPSNPATIENPMGVKHLEETRVKRDPEQPQVPDIPSMPGLDEGKPAATAEPTIIPLSGDDAAIWEREKAKWRQQQKGKSPTSPARPAESEDIPGMPGSE